MIMRSRAQNLHQYAAIITAIVEILPEIMEGLVDIIPDFVNKLF